MALAIQIKTGVTVEIGPDVRIRLVEERGHTYLHIDAPAELKIRRIAPGVTASAADRTCARCNSPIYPNATRCAACGKDTEGAKQ